MRDLGRIVMSEGIRKVTAEFPGFHHIIQDALEKFKENDWGIVSEDDAEVNFMALEEKEMVLGAYPSPIGEKIWLITDFYSRNDYRKVYGEPESSEELLPVTTILFPAEH